MNDDTGIYTRYIVLGATVRCALHEICSISTLQSLRENPTVFSVQTNNYARNLKTVITSTEVNWELR